MSRVSLYGGPASGMDLEWKGGDVIALPARPGSPAALEPPSFSDLDKVHLYRRSIRNEAVFVYQP